MTADDSLQALGLLTPHAHRSKANATILPEPKVENPRNLALAPIIVSAHALAITVN